MGLSSKDVSSAGNSNFDWSQQIGGALDTAKPTGQANSGRTRGTTASSLKCPRCESTNTKFCYYNNYSRTQPRHLCRACKRHWTAGGTLRNVPVGGARKNKRPRTKDDGNRPQHKQQQQQQQQQQVAPAAALPSAAELESGFADVLRQLMLPVQSMSAPLSMSLPPSDYNINHYSSSDIWSSSQYGSYGGGSSLYSSNWNGVATDFGTQALEEAAADDFSANLP